MTETAALLAASELALPEARALLAQVLACPREALIAHPERVVAPGAVMAFEALAARRRAGVPMAYLRGEQEFWGRSFLVTTAVLIPRPDTETLVEQALTLMQDTLRPIAVDLGTGSGCIGITLALEHPGALVTLTDASAEALAVARANAERLGAAVHLAQGHWTAALAAGLRADLIVSNPPYVAPGDPHLDALRFEPAAALVSADGGLADLAAIAAQAGAYLRSAGWLLLEHGHDQAERVRQLLTDAGYAEVSSARDSAGIERVTRGRRRADGIA